MNSEKNILSRCYVPLSNLEHSVGLFITLSAWIINRIRKDQQEFFVDPDQRFAILNSSQITLCSMMMGL